MAERGSDPQSYLAEIDRRLREIQAEFAPPGRTATPGRAAGREPPPHPVEDRPAAGRGRTGPLETVLKRAKPPGVALPPRTDDPTGLQAKLMAAIDDLIRAYECSIAATPTPTPSSADELMLSAGPFSSIAELREFQRALTEIPGVLEVSVRGYEGADRALIEVRLGGAVT
jgi:hypothetical protein